MENKMLVMFEKYWDAIHGIMAVACVLDPRYKMCLLEYFYEKIYGSERYEGEIERINITCFALLLEYQLELSTKKGVVVSSNISSSSQLKSDKGGAVLEGYDKYVGLEKKMSSRSWNINWRKISCQEKKHSIFELGGSPMVSSILLCKLLQEIFMQFLFLRLLRSLHLVWEVGW
ncbi:DUF4413 domain-containing protein [Cephalotus follicularis]|uniref:DUF4413 domain-containing protein n=1 Tax=Cephalotus follicularis TaxID=3775 RepID=A0A1Q3B0X1_CEPFO|nr:DUF4413 domain-containing protein [Cephalotus follicularis]